MWGASAFGKLGLSVGQPGRSAGTPRLTTDPPSFQSTAADALSTFQASGDGWGLSGRWSSRAPSAAAVAANPAATTCGVVAAGEGIDPVDIHRRQIFRASVG